MRRLQRPILVLVRHQPLAKHQALDLARQPRLQRLHSVVLAQRPQLPQLHQQDFRLRHQRRRNHQDLVHLVKLQRQILVLELLQVGFFRYSLTLNNFKLCFYILTAPAFGGFGTGLGFGQTNPTTTSAFSFNSPAFGATTAAAPAFGGFGSSKEFLQNKK